MKKQTYIAYLRDENKQAITFERFACKRAETVRKQMNILLASDLYRACVKGVKTVEIHATKDGYHAEPIPEIIMIV